MTSRLSAIGTGLDIKDSKPRFQTIEVFYQNHHSSYGIITSTKVSDIIYESIRILGLFSLSFESPWSEDAEILLLNDKITLILNIYVM